jgi:hypothetical protein
MQNALCEMCVITEDQQQHNLVQQGAASADPGLMQTPVQLNSYDNNTDVSGGTTAHEAGWGALLVVGRRQRHRQLSGSASCERSSSSDEDGSASNEARGGGVGPHGGALSGRRQHPNGSYGTVLTDVGPARTDRSSV